MKTLARSPYIAALAVATALTLSACSFPGGPGTETGGSAQETASEVPAPPPVDPSEAASSPASASGEGAAAGGDASEVSVGTSMTDPETGDVVTIVSAVRNNPTEYYEASNNPNGEMVYLEVKVVPGENYGGSISVSEFFLMSGGEEVNFAATAAPELEDAGYTYFDMAPRRDGEHTGYVPIFIPESSSTIEGAYVRPEADVLGEDRSLPEFRGTFTVPAA